MSVTLYNNGEPVEMLRSTFPGGESFIRITDYEEVRKPLQFKFMFENNGDLIDLAMMLDACKRFYTKDTEYHLDMPYLPYARQDRVMTEGESLSVKVVCDFINSLKFEKVFVKDIHSDVGAALLDNLVHIKQSDCAFNLLGFCRPENTILISPDAGAEKKVFDVAKKLGYTDIIRASKVRNVATGKIERTTIIDEISMKDMLIVDDLADAGGTFIALAEAIRNDSWYEGQKISLYVTHGLFSAGVDKFKGIFDKIYVHNLMNMKYNDHPLIQMV